MHGLLLLTLITIFYPQNYTQKYTVEKIVNLEYDKVFDKWHPISEKKVSWEMSLDKDVMTITREPGSPLWKYGLKEISENTQTTTIIHTPGLEKLIFNKKAEKLISVRAENSLRSTAIDFFIGKKISSN